MTEENTLAIGSIAQDLKRVALFIARGSTANARRFLAEAEGRQQDIQLDSVPLYLKKYIAQIDGLINEKDLEALAEKALTIGVILQNSVVAARR